MKQLVVLVLMVLPALAACGENVGDAFTIGVYYAMPQLEPSDNFGWDYAFMDIARIGCNRIVVSGNCWADGWAALKHWDIKGITSYGQLNDYPGPGNWDPEDHAAGIIVTRDFNDGLVWDAEPLGDTIIGHIMTDEPECSGLTEDEKNFLRTWADTYHQYNPTRQVWVNHCDPPWYDLNEKHASCSAAPTICVNGFRITNRIAAAQGIGLDNFTVVALLGHISAWADNQCGRISYFELGPCSQDVFDWLAARTNQQDAYEEMITAYEFGALGFQPYMYNQHRGYSLVDIDGNDQYGIRTGFSAAAHDIRRSQGWPQVELFNNGAAFNDRGNYPPGNFTLTAEATSTAGTIEKVVFGKTTNGGSDWQTIEDTTAPYAATFTAQAGETVIFRARAVDTQGKQSIFAAYMVYVN